MLRTKRQLNYKRSNLIPVEAGRQKNINVMLLEKLEV